jgi:hypothetical protein
MLEAARGRLYRRGMPSFDYNAPAELFLSKPAKRAVAPSTGGSRQPLRRSAMPLRTYEDPKPSARGLRSGMSASTVPKSNACTKPLIIRRASLSDRTHAAPALSSPHALRHEAVLGRPVKRLAVRAHCFASAGVPLALLHEAHPGSAVERLAARAHRLAIARLRCNGADYEAAHQGGNNNNFHRLPLPMLRSRRRSLDPLDPTVMRYFL